MAILFAGEDQSVNGGALTDLLRVTTDSWVGSTGLSGDQFYAFAEAIIAHESAWSAKAYHFDGPDSVLNASYGLMQVEGVTAEGYGMSDAAIAAGGLYDIPTNLAYGVRRLAEALQRQGGSMALAAADYNEGPGNVAKGYADAGYVNDVLTKYQTYFTANTGAADPAVPNTGGGINAPLVVGLIVAGLLGWALLV